MRRDTLFAHLSARGQERGKGRGRREEETGSKRGQGSLPHGEATTSQREEEDGEKRRSE